jgi:SpoVK/Ycf46/Vps4 family AAA+-type ATPase
MRISAPRGDVRSNIMLIGPYGCGKTEMAKAICSDKRIIGFSLGAGDLLTAYMHESVKNVKRMFEAAKEMRKQSRNTKPVAIVLDEFDRLFSYGEGVHQAYDGKRMEGALQELMDGVVGYEGIFLVALTNIPKAVPAAILRRFKYVDVVGQLTTEERISLFKQFLTRGLPISGEVSENNYQEWAEKLVDAPGSTLQIYE